MEPKQFEELIETVLNGPDDEAQKAEEVLQREASQEDIPRLEELLLNPKDNLLQEAVAVPYARLRGTSALETLLRAYQVYLGSYSESEDIQTLLTNIVESDATGSSRILGEIMQESDPRVRQNASWLLEWSRCESIRNPLTHTPLVSRVVAAEGSVDIVLWEPPDRTWKLRFSRVQAYRHIHGSSFRPLTRRDSWIVRVPDSGWSRELLGQAHMHPHPNPGRFAHHHLGSAGATIDVLSSGDPEFREVRD